MRSIYAVGMIVSTIAAVFGSLMVALVFLIGPLPHEPPDAPQRKLAIFGTATVLFVGAAIFCGRRARRRVIAPKVAGAIGIPERSSLMNWFDKCCAALAGALGVAMILLGVMGLFVGCRGAFRLPPVLGVLPALVGWGTFRSVLIAWRAPRATLPPVTRDAAPLPALRPLPRDSFNECLWRLSRRHGGCFDRFGRGDLLAAFGALARAGADVVPAAKA